MRRKMRKSAIQEEKLTEVTWSKKIPEIPSPVRPSIDSTSSSRSFERFVRAVLVRRK